MTPMSSARTHDLARAVVGAAEEVFGSVEAVRGQIVALHREVADAGGVLCADDISSLAPGIRSRLATAGDLVVGLGLIMTPGLLSDQSLRLEWWQSEPDEEEAVALQVDLNPDSPGFYDYEVAEWFDEPRRSGGRHIVGPYVDVHGTGRYVFTFTAPVLCDGGFLGVAGADVSAPRLERRLLEELGSEPDVVITNSEQRVVLSTSPRTLPGDLLMDSDDAERAAVEVALPDLPWRLRVANPPKH